MPAEELASVFLLAHFSDSDPTFPINPFQILADEGIAFNFTALSYADQTGDRSRLYESYYKAIIESASELMVI